MYIFWGVKMIWLVMKNLENYKVIIVIFICYVFLSYCYIYCRMNFYILEVIVLFIIFYMGWVLILFCYLGDFCFFKIIIINVFVVFFFNGFVVFFVDI